MFVDIKETNDSHSTNDCIPTNIIVCLFETESELIHKNCFVKEFMTNKKPMKIGSWLILTINH